jgi:small neutral amino acid transporter SnatA (MarC family)
LDWIGFVPLVVVLLLLLLFYSRTELLLSLFHITMETAHCYSSVLLFFGSVLAHSIMSQPSALVIPLKLDGPNYHE